MTGEARSAAPSGRLPLRPDLLRPLLGLAVGAAAGALGGSLAIIGMDKDFIERVREEIRPGRSALFVLACGAVVRPRPRGAFQGIPSSGADPDEPSERGQQALRVVRTGGRISQDRHTWRADFTLIDQPMYNDAVASGAVLIVPQRRRPCRKPLPRDLHSRSRCWPSAAASASAYSGIDVTGPSL